MVVNKINIPKSVAFLYTKYIHDLVGVQSGTAIMENDVVHPQRLEINLTHDTSTPLLRIYLKESIPYDRNACIFVFIRYRNQPRYSLANEHKGEMWHIYMMEFLFNCKENLKYEISNKYKELETFIPNEIT